MGLDMRPLGKPKPGFEKHFAEIFDIVSNGKIPKPSFIDILRRRKLPTEEDLLKEWYDNQHSTYETIKAPMVGRDKKADDWLKERYAELENKPPYAEFYKKHEGYYVIPLAEEQDGVPCYIALQQDENVFRGQFLTDCIDLIGEELVNEAWETKLAKETLDYGDRLMTIADKIAKEHGLEYLKKQRMPSDVDENTIESKLHILYSLAKWLVFYGKNGHGYEADY